MSDSPACPPRLAGVPDLIAAYYGQRLARFGANARGVDWRDEAGQQLRFEQLARAFPTDPFDLCEVGCGYGALHDWVRRAGLAVDHHQGVDVSGAMVGCAQQRHADDPRFEAREGWAPSRSFDVCVASGTFNVRAGTSAEDWSEWVHLGIETLAAHSRRAFAFNMLSCYAHPEKMSPDLHYADPLAVFDLCKRRYSRDVSLLHDYGLFEFTIVVRKGAPPVEPQRG